MSEAPARRWPLRLRIPAGRPPLGAVFGGIGVLAGAAVALLHLDRLPVVFCTFKSLTGLPCPTCGSTRALGRLAVLDLAGALRMNPLGAVVLALVAVWALVDLSLWPRHRALLLEVHPRWAWRLRIAALALFLANWVYLLIVRR